MRARRSTRLWNSSLARREAASEGASIEASRPRSTIAQLLSSRAPAAGAAAKDNAGGGHGWTCTTNSMTEQQIRAGAMARQTARRRPAGVAVGIVCCILLQTASAATSPLNSTYSGVPGSGGRTRSDAGLSSNVTVAPDATTQLSPTSSAHAGADLPASWPAAATTAVTTGTPTEQENCQLQGDRSYEPMPAAISAVVAACGCVMLLAGYRVYRLSFLIGGILLGAAFSYVALTECRAATALGIEATVCIVVGVGSVLGLCAALIPIVGHVLLAAACGSVLSLTIFTVAAAFIGLQPVTVVAGVTAAAGFAAGVAAAVSLRRPRPQAFVTVICTAAIGAMLVLVCVDYFLELYLLLSSMYRVLLGPLDRGEGTAAAAAAAAAPTSGPLFEISAPDGGVSYATPALYAIANEEVQRLHGSSPEQFGTVLPRRFPKLCFYTWIVLAAWPLLTAVGALVQWNVTAKQVDNFTGVWCKTKSSRRASLTKTRGGSGGALESETAWKRFRNIYSARRSAGDVVATAYTKGSKKFSSVRRTPLHSETDDDTCLNTAKSSFKV